MDKTSYRLTCLNCKQSDVLTISDSNHLILDFERGVNTPFLSGRWRGDQAWGWECVCGNDNRIASVEKGDFDRLVVGSPGAIKKLAATLKIPDAKQFKLEKA